MCARCNRSCDAVMQAYGVEAARATLAREVQAVFGAYGIAVDPRHISLIADHMTQQARTCLQSTCLSWLCATA